MFLSCFEYCLAVETRKLKEMTGRKETSYTSLAVVYAPLPNKASGAVHFTGRRP